jgi:hypothetical protein
MVERLAANIDGVWTCALADKRCAGVQGKRQDDLNSLRQQGNWNSERLFEELTRAPEPGQQAEPWLCDTCWLFGSTYVASRVEFADLYPVDASLAPTSVRDGVGIDRDTGRAMAKHKFDYEVVEPGPEFGLEITLSSRRSKDLGLICLGLNELQAGRVPLGGKVSRGLGRVRLVNLHVFSLDLADDRFRRERLQTYVLARLQDPPAGVPFAAVGMEPVADVDGFLRDAIIGLIGRDADAQPAV